MPVSAEWEILSWQIMWLLLAQSASAGLLSGQVRSPKTTPNLRATPSLRLFQVLEEICGTQDVTCRFQARRAEFKHCTFLQDLTLSPANPCFFRLFSLVWHVCW